MTKVYLIRHGQSVKNSRRNLYGKDDSPLTKKGIKQAEATGKYLSSFHIDSLYSSNLIRSKTTANIIGKHLNLTPIEEEELRECSALESRELLFDSMLIRIDRLINRKNPNLKRQVKLTKVNYDHRVIKCFYEIIKRHPNQSIAIVAHSGSNKVILKALQDSAGFHIVKPRQHNCCINIIEIEDMKLKNLRNLDFIEHLQFI